jgi:hypothetical protein
MFPFERFHLLDTFIFGYQIFFFQIYRVHVEVLLQIIPRDPSFSHRELANVMWESRVQGRCGQWTGNVLAQGCSVEGRLVAFCKKSKILMYFSTE